VPFSSRKNLLKTTKTRRRKTAMKILSAVAVTAGGIKVPLVALPATIVANQ
jgi:hypothetical protein